MGMCRSTKQFGIFRMLAISGYKHHPSMMMILWYNNAIIIRSIEELIILSAHREELSYMIKNDW
jgi:hypothetical protein